jgi:hypothetical protein
VSESAAPPPAPAATHFLNVDLDVWSRRDLTPLADHFAGITLHLGRTSRGWRASFESARQYAGAEPTVRALLRAVDALPVD